MVFLLQLHVDTGHPPCLFQALCTCSKPAGDLGIVTCKHVPILRVPAAVNSSKVFTLQLTGNKIRDLEPHFFQATGMSTLKYKVNEKIFAQILSLTFQIIQLNNLIKTDYLLK